MEAWANRRRTNNGCSCFGPGWYSKHRGLSEDLPSETNQGASPRLQAGGREPGAKQKAFGTVLATAPSPAFYLAAKKSHGQLGDLFAASEKPERERWKGGVLERQ